VLENNVQVDFFKDSAGKYSKLRLLFADGNGVDKSVKSISKNSKLPLSTGPKDFGLLWREGKGCG